MALYPLMMWMYGGESEEVLGSLAFTAEMKMSFIEATASLTLGGVRCLLLARAIRIAEGWPRSPDAGRAHCAIRYPPPRWQNVPASGESVSINVVRIGIGVGQAVMAVGYNLRAAGRRHAPRVYCAIC